MQISKSVSTWSGLALLAAPSLVGRRFLRPGTGAVNDNARVLEEFVKTAEFRGFQAAKVAQRWAFSRNGHIS
jgi:hypothetical protein